MKKVPGLGLGQWNCRGAGKYMYLHFLHVSFLKYPASSHSNSNVAAFFNTPVLLATEKNWKVFPPSAHLDWSTAHARSWFGRQVLAGNLHTGSQQCWESGRSLLDKEDSHCSQRDQNKSSRLRQCKLDVQLPAATSCVHVKLSCEESGQEDRPKLGRGYTAWTK